jgi:hypothetical protein
VVKSPFSNTHLQNHHTLNPYPLHSPVPHPHGAPSPRVYANAKRST